MKPIHIQIGVTIDAENATTVIELIGRAVEQGMSKQPTGESIPISAHIKAAKKMTPLEAPRHALFGGQDPDEMGLLIDTRQASKLLGVSSRKLYTMYSSGEMPAPTRIGRAVRWGYEELRAWVNAGCPPASDWQWSG